MELGEVFCAFGEEVPGLGDLEEEFLLDTLEDVDVFLVVGVAGLLVVLQVAEVLQPTLFEGLVEEG